MARGEVSERLRRLGLLGANGQDRFREHVIVPAFDARGSVVQLAAYAPNGTLSWLFPNETPVLWNGAVLQYSPQAVVAADPLSALALLAKGEETVVAPAGPGVPLGVEARELLLATGPVLVLRDCEHLREEIEKLGISVERGGQEKKVFSITADENGFTAEFPRRLLFVCQGLHQDSPRHLRASVKVFRKPLEGASASERPRLHLDTFDLYHARSRIGFAKTAACLLGEDPTLMEDYLGRLVAAAEDYLRARKESPACTVVSGIKIIDGALITLRDGHWRRGRRSRAPARGGSGGDDSAA